MKKYPVSEDKNSSPEDDYHKKYHNFYEKVEARIIAQELKKKLENGGDPSAIYNEIITECIRCEKYTSGSQVGKCPFPNPTMATYICPIWPVKNEALKKKSRLNL
jgi:hypothetical protein